jgi:hypothetical protein
LYKPLAPRIRHLLTSGEYEDGRVSRRIRLTDGQREALTAHAEALEGIGPEMPVEAVVGRWARARRCWCEITGEALI